ncbi:MAG: hypothetical protein E7D39_07610, partial [Bifidobacterium longum]|nr:hypothetical protein [Bifidobacterium longum]
PGKELTIAYTVRVSSDATHPLNVVTTPVVNADGIETGSNGKVTDECPADKSSTNGADGANGGADGGRNDAHKGASSDPSASLDALDKLKSQISCPVDLKSLAGSM